MLTGVVAIAVSLTACGDDSGSDETSTGTSASVTDSGSDTTSDAEPDKASGFAGNGQAIIRILPPEGDADSALGYTVDGTCETSGADITFTGPGDPSFTVGITTGGAPADNRVENVFWPTGEVIHEESGTLQADDQSTTFTFTN